MPRNYEPKTQALSPARLQKIAKDALKSAETDNKLAYETYRYFKKSVDENPTDDTSKKCMIDSLRLSQTSKNTITSILKLMIELDKHSDRSDQTKATGGFLNNLDEIEDG